MKLEISESRLDVAITGIIGVARGYGGFETLAQNLIGENSPVTAIYCSSQYFSEKPADYGGASMIYLPVRSKGMTKILHTSWAIFHAAITGKDVLLVLGVSGGFALPFAKLAFPRMKIITNIDGLEWQRGKWSWPVRKILEALEILSCRFSDILITDNPVLTKYVRHRYDLSSVEIAYGGEQSLAGREEAGKRCDEVKALGLCRIVPENNVEMILGAFSQVSVPLTFIGNWGDSKYGRDLKAKYSNFDHLTLLDPIFSQERLFELRSSAHIYVHGHSVGGTNPSLVEMMHFGVEVLAFDCDYNRSTLHGYGRYFYESSQLVSLIKEYKQEPFNDGASIKRVAMENYTWADVRKKYFELFR